MTKDEPDKNYGPVDFVSWSELAKFRIAYNKAKKEGNSEFMWKDTAVLTQYAKYLIEYMDSKPKFK